MLVTKILLHNFYIYILITANGVHNYQLRIFLSCCGRSKFVALLGFHTIGNCCDFNMRYSTVLQIIKYIAWLDKFSGNSLIPYYLIKNKGRNPRFMTIYIWNYSEMDLLIVFSTGYPYLLAFHFIEFTFLPGTPYRRRPYQLK